MIARRPLVAALLCVILGCSADRFADKPPESERFTNEAEELEYLTVLANPSVSQFKRRKELQAKADAEAVFADLELNAERHEREKAKREAKAQELLAEAQEYDKEHPVPDAVVVRRYRQLLSEYSDTTASETAQTRFNELRTEIERREKAEEK